MYLCETYTEGLYSYDFGDDDMCSIILYAPWDMNDVNEYIEKLNMNTVIISPIQWRVYVGNNEIINIYMINTEGIYYFVYELNFIK